MKLWRVNELAYLQGSQGEVSDTKRVSAARFPLTRVSGNTHMFMRSAPLIAAQMAAVTRNGSIFLVSCFLME